MNTVSLIKAQGLVKKYGGVIATDDVSIELARNEVLGIIGPNGAGKSTLVGLLAGALPADSGQIVFDGKDITALPASERARRGIARTYQIPRPFMDMSVRENLLAAHFSVHPWESGPAAITACNKILDSTGLADATYTLCRDLPLLRRKRLEVARALALQPKLLLLDEVGAGLVDSEVTELIDLIRSIREDVEGIIIIEHVLRIVRECCSQLVVINFGKKVAEGATAEVLASDEVAAVYLGTAHGSTGQTITVSVATSERESGHLADIHGSSALVANGTRNAPVDHETPLLELRDIHAGYGQARVLNGISLKIRPGQVVAILGTNGAGKTTLSNVISGAILPTAGRMLIDGTNVTGKPAHHIARLGLAQCMEGRRIFATLTVEENLLLPARAVPNGQLMDRLEKVYQLFPDLKERRHSSGTSMSGGQQQMLAIGRALMSQPRLIVFDEISLGLAPIVMDRLYAALAELKHADLTMLIVEQDVERALDLSDDVHVMEHGRFALSGTPKSIRDNPMLRDLYIGSAE